MQCEGTQIPQIFVNVVLNMEGWYNSNVLESYQGRPWQIRTDLMWSANKCENSDKKSENSESKSENSEGESERFERKGEKLESEK